MNSLRRTPEPLSAIRTARHGAASGRPAPTPAALPVNNSSQTPRPPRRPGAANARFPALAAALAVFLLVLPAGPEAHAQTPEVLVSNVGQTINDATDFATDDLAQSFTTGTDARGYILTAIELQLASTSGTTPPTVTLHSGSATGTVVATFTGPASIGSTDAYHAFTPVGTVTLNSSTTYWVVAEGGATGGRWSNTSSTSEDGTPAAGWSIADVSEFRAASSTGSFSVNTFSVNYIRVRGSINYGPIPSDVQLDAPSGTAGFLRVRWAAGADAGTAAYQVRARPTVDTETAEYIGKYFTGGRFRRVATDVRDYTFYGLVPGITYRSQVCRVTAKHAHYAGYDTLGECSPWQNIRLPSAANADRNDVKVTLEFADGSAKTTLTPDTHGTLNYRVRLSGINDLSQYRSPRWGAGSWALFLKPNESRKTHRLGPGYGQVPEYFGHVHRGANLSHLTWDGPTSGYIDQSFTLTSSMRSRGPLIVELFEHRTDHSNTDLGSQRKLCVDFEDAMGDVAAPCPSSQQAADPATVVGAPVLSGAGDDGSWSEGETVGVTVTFSEAVEVDTGGGTPAIGVTLGGPGGAARSASYESGSGTTTLTFGYTLVQGDGSHAHMAVTPNSLAAGGGAIRGAASGVDANLAHAGAAAAGNLARSAGPTASFLDVPESHDGATAFKLNLRFGGVPAGLDAKRDAASVLEVTGGSVTGARQTAAGTNPVWEVTVTPAGMGGVTVRLPARACDVAHAVCIGGQPLGEAVEAAVKGPPVTARFTQAPSSHDGSGTFDLQMAFSHEIPRYSFKTVHKHLFDVTGGRIEKANRLSPPSNRGWNIRVRPDGGGAVTLAARATTDCAAQYAACAADGRMFDGDLSLTVPGPDTPTAEATTAEEPALPTVSIAAPGTTPVSEGTALAFTLTRTGTTDDALTVGVSVSESGNVLGNAPPTTVTFAANSATATLSVPTLDDATAEDASTVTVTLTAGTGYAVDADAGSASATVESEDIGPVTARFTQVPVEHDGNAFVIEFAFSREIRRYSFRTVHRHLFEVTGGRIDKANRLSPPSNVGWAVRVVPDGLGPVTLAARATTDCAAQYAACDAEGRMFDGELTTTVLGPPTLSVADAEVEEADGATLDFVVTLSRALGETVTVRYATADGTAASGDDYTAASGTLAFQASEVSKTVSVAVLDDPHDEGSETLTLTLSNPSPARVKLADAEATGTIANTDAMPKAWIARFGRTTAEQVLDAVESRMRAARRPGAEIRLAGERIGLRPAFAAGADAADETARKRIDAARDAEEDRAARDVAAWFKGGPEAGRRGFGARSASAGRTRTMDGSELLLGSSFMLAGEAGGPGSGGGAVALWGRGAVSGFEGRDGDLTVDGEVASAMLGADWSRGPAMLGLVVGRSAGEGDYRAPAGAGVVRSTLTGVYPWGRHALTEGVEIWGAAGYGAGTLTLTPDGAAAMRTDLDLWMAAVGLRGALIDGGGDGPTLLAKTDAMTVETSTDAVRGDLAASEAGVTRLRLGLEAALPLRLADGSVLTPGAELGVRHDGGDAETGFGTDIGGSLAWADPKRGLSAELRGRGLLTHEAKRFRERGISGSLGWDPVPGERGPQLSLTQTFGGPSSGGAEALLARRTLAGLAAGPGGSEARRRRLEAKLGYGFGAFGDGFTLTPEVGAGFSNAGREYSLGWRLTNGGSGTPGAAFALSSEALRRESPGDDTPPEHRIGLRLDARF